MADKSILAATGLMLLLSLLLSWIPLVGPLVAGGVGGWKAGTPGRAALAAILPALVAGLVVGLFVGMIPEVAGWLAALFGAALAIWILLQMGLVFVGALLGGAMGAAGPPTRRIEIAR